MSELYRDFIDRKADQIINGLGGTITPAPGNAELYRDFLDRKFDDVINAIGNVKVKSFTYKGVGGSVNAISFPVKPKYILSITGSIPSYLFQVNPFYYGQTRSSTSAISLSSYTTSVNTIPIDISFNNNIITITGANTNRAMNTNDVEYTVYYI